MFWFSGSLLQGERLPEKHQYSELTKTSTALPRLVVLSVLSAARRLVLIFVNSLSRWQKLTSYRKTRAELPGLLWLAGLLADVIQQLLRLSLNAAAF